MPARANEGHDGIGLYTIGYSSSTQGTGMYDVTTRAAVGMGIPMGIPMDMGVG